MQNWAIKNSATVLGETCPASGFFTVKGCFADAPTASCWAFDASGLHALPGIVDLHGDGFERNISPRPSVTFPLEQALLQTDQQLICNGITTAYLALTISWEPGLRSLDSAAELIESWARLRPRFSCDIRLQLRWEVFALDAVPTIKSWLALDPKPSFALNDHVTSMIRKNSMKDFAKNGQRCGLTADEYKNTVMELAKRQDEVDRAVAGLVSVANEAGVICFSHDELTPQARIQNRAIGVTVSEFPLTMDTAAEARRAGESTVLGAPNVLRGRSHVGAVNATEAIGEGNCNVLASDYHYPSQLLAVTKLGKGDPKEVAKYWPLISVNPAQAVDLHDRGTFTTGARADFILLDYSQNLASVEAVFTNGVCAYVRDISRVIQG